MKRINGRAHNYIRNLTLARSLWSGQIDHTPKINTEILIRKIPAVRRLRRPSIVGRSLVCDSLGAYPTRGAEALCGNQREPND